MDHLESTLTLWRRSNEGDGAARDLLFSRYLPRLMRWARGRLPDGARGFLETRDIVQEVVLKTLRAANFDPEHSGAFGAYLRKGIKNRILDEVKRISRHPLKEGTVGDLVDSKPAPDEVAIGREALARYDASLLRLEPHAQENVIHRCEFGFSYREIAEMLDRPSPDAVRMSVIRAVEEMAKDMAR